MKAIFNKAYMFLLLMLVNSILIFKRNKRKKYLFGSDTHLKNSNSYYMFTKMLELGYDCFWVYKDVVKLDLIPQDKLIKYGSFEHIKLSINCRAFFITHTIFDASFGRIRDSFVVNLWHGIPIKKLGFHSKVFKESLNKKLFFKNRTEFKHWDLFCCSSPFYRDILSDAFHLDKNSILVAGSPKNYRKVVSKKSAFEYSSYDKVVLYAPTYRPWKSKYLDFLSSPKFHEFLVSNNYCFLVKLHPYENNNVNVRNFSNIILLESSSVSIEELYEVSDVLVTDFSSSIFDFSLLQKKFIFFSSDFDEYENAIGGSYIDVKIDFADCFCSDIESLISLLIIALSDEKFTNSELSKYIKKDIEIESIDIIIEHLKRLNVLG